MAMDVCPAIYRFYPTFKQTVLKDRCESSKVSNGPYDIFGAVRFPAL